MQERKTRLFVMNFNRLNSLTVHLEQQRQYTSVFPAIRRGRKENQEFKATNRHRKLESSLDYVRPCLTKQKGGREGGKMETGSCCRVW